MEAKLADNIDNNVIAQNVGTTTQQIFMPKNTPVQAPVAAGINIQNGQPTLSVTVPEVGMLSGHVSLFGYEVSKMTLLIVLVFLAIVGIYFYYNKKSSSTDNEEDCKTDKKKSKKSKKKSQPKVEDKESSSEESD